MSAPRFVPLTCPSCSGNLLGRAQDRVAFCPPCARGYRVDGDHVVALPVLVAGNVPGADLALPFWRRGGLAWPAFTSARPLLLARLVTLRLEEWSVEPIVGPPWPLGARLAPETFEQALAFAGLDAPPAATPLELVGVPVRHVDRRWHLPGECAVLYPDDVLEGTALLESSLVRP